MNSNEAGKGLFFKIDKAIFDLVDKYQGGPTYQKFSDNLRNLHEETRKILNYIFTLSAIAVPIFIVLILGLMNIFKSHEIQVLEEDFQTVQLILKKEDQVRQLHKLVVAQTIVTEKGQLESRIKTQLTGLGIDEKKIKISNFEVVNSRVSFNKSTGILKFSELSFQEFSNLVDKLVNVEKIIFNKIELIRDDQKSLLQGSLDFTYFSKNK